MIGVIVLPGPSAEMHGLDAKRSLSLLPLGDRPMLQHIIESLVVQGVSTIEIIVEHAPEQVETLFGNGDRWGCSIRYHLAIQPERPYRSLKVIAGTRCEPWVLIHADRYPWVELPTAPVSKPHVYYGSLRSANDGTTPEKGDSVWQGTAVFPAGVLEDRFTNQTVEELSSSLQAAVAAGEAERVEPLEWIDISTPHALLTTQAKLLGRKMDGLIISGTERQQGIWISRNVVIHPTVELVAPLYVGPNCRLNRGVRLGPNVVLSGDCIVDSGTTVEHSLITSGNYIGEALELNSTVVDHNLLVNARLGTGIDIQEGFLLGGLAKKRKQSWLGRAAQSVAALILFVVFLPITILSMFYFAIVRRLTYTSILVQQTSSNQSSRLVQSYSLPCLGPDAWKVHRPAGWDAFQRQFLPGLMAVVLGRLNFVGLPPRTVEEVEQLPAEWRSMYLNGRTGLITESSIASTDAQDQMHLYLADAYYSARRNWIYDLKLFTTYLLRLVSPAGERRQNVPAEPVSAETTERRVLTRES